MEFDTRSGTFRDASTVELQASQGRNDLEYSFLDYVGRGVASAATSAAVGIINTGVAFGETLGIAEEEHYIDEAEAVESIWGETTGEFYRQHKVGLDAAGMVAGSFIPGLGAIRALRIAQRAGKLPVMTQLKTGMRNPDIILNSKALETAKQSVYTSRVPGVANPEVMRAYAGGVGQAFMESAAFDFAVVATMNQNATLNPEDLDYLSAAKNVFTESLPFTFIGGAAGGGLEILKARGAIKKWVDAEYARTGHLRVPDIQAMRGLTPGDKLVTLGKAAESHRNLIKAVDETDQNAQAAWKNGQSQLKQGILDTAEELGVTDKEQLDVLNGLMDRAGNGEYENITKIISGLSKIDKVTQTDFRDLARFYDKVPGPTAIVQGDSIDSIAAQLASRQEEFANILSDMGIEARAGQLGNNNFKVLINEMNDAAGFASPREHVGRSNVIRGEDDQPINLNLVKTGYSNEAAFIPDFISLNNKSIEKSYAISKRLGELTKNGFNQSLDEYKEFVFLHELGHVKTNTAKTLTLVQNMMALGNNRETFRELVTASVRGRKAEWTTATNKLKDREMVDEVLEYFENPKYSPDEQPGWINYLGSPQELLADGAAYMTQTATRQRAAREMPHLAKFFNENGSIAKAWDDTKAFYNSRTGQVNSSVLPGVNDIDPNAKVVVTKKGAELRSNTLKTTFKRDPKAFDDLTGKVRRREVDVLAYDAQWNIMARMENKDIFPSSRDAIIDIPENDIPLLERVTKELDTDPELANQFRDRVRYMGETLTPSRLKAKLTDKKAQLRDELMLDATTPYMNERKMEKILNTSEEFAMGVNTADSMLMGTKDFSKQEIHRFAYKHKTPEEYTGNAISMQGYQFRDQVIDQQREMVAAELLGDNFGNFTEVDWNKIYSISPTSRRTTMIAGLRPEFGSLREWAQYIGKQTTNALSKIIQNVDEGFVKHYDTFNRAGNTKLRMELAEIDNLARRQWYYKGSVRVPTEDGGEKVQQVLVNKHLVQDAFNELNKQAGGALGEWSPSYLEDMPRELYDAVAGAKRHGDPGAISLSDEVGEFVGKHIETNKDIVYKKQRLAMANGKEAVYDENVFYTPPRNLAREKYNAFVVPSQAQAGSDPRQYMIFGQTEAEFNAKLQQISEKYGSKYRVVTQEDVSQHKRLRGEYEQGNVFDELFFDSEVSRMGKSSELLPNLDIESSGTLDRYREWTIRQEEALFRNGVELKYSKVVESLKRLDKEFGKVGRTGLAKEYKPEDSIWKDTLNTMLATRSHGSMAEQMFVRVNDFIGNIGSDVIDNAFNAFRPSRNKLLVNDQTMKEFNDQMERAGLQAPTRNAIEAITSSPRIKNSRTLNEMVRTLSNFTSLGMLRLDWAHSMLQVMSTPILGLPVLKEMQQSLRGTAAGQQLENVTSVVNPSTGAKEPSPYKLFAEGTQKFFTDEGKAFLTELRDRNIISDYLIQYLDTLDFSTFNGSHSLQQISAKTDQIAQRLSKVSLFTQSEEMTRFQVAWAAKRIGEIGGMSQDELWPMISSSVDKVHGVYIGNQRPQLFKGVLGQAVGLYQTYFFNFMQNMMKYYQDGERANLITMAGMQTSLFGVQSWTGFDQLNQLIGETNRGNLDLFNVTSADDPNSLASYFMYGLGSHSLGFPIDFYSRGDLSVRHPTVIPTSPWDFPVVSTMSKAVGNIYNTGKMAFGDDVPLGETLLHGMANNGLNRPLAGLADIMRNRVTSANGQVMWDDTNFLGDTTNQAEEVYWGGIFSRIIGAKPLNESITANAFYRDAAYKANYRNELTSLGSKIQLNIADGNVGMGTYRDFLKDYERIGGEPQEFNAYWMRQLQNARKPVMEEFRRETEQEKAYQRILQQRSSSLPWDDETSLTAQVPSSSSD